MTTPPEEPGDSGSPPPFSIDEVADLRAGRLSADEAARVRTRMAQDPERTQRMLAALDGVDDAFPEPENFNDPLISPEVDARLLAAIDRAEQRRDLGLPPEHHTDGEGQDDDGQQEEHRGNGDRARPPDEEA